ncbi:XRE family transcriptional regulator [Chryseobacterium carnipullorum]|uniref:Helix-turn-helix n=1 Tax=Chryseobacterium carnipullorum TaxID=1124835 RepID=A0A376DSR0_CHRCU|nr:helix-turn-helix transcriptional regulator [Chryseobacterium carnipullorum]AZA49581.1 XRE family transcriptional regulator [Chryseobacterium carnipullorum]AZA64479.1 XRE family transcriptional regulator [Chryseobacterium carnipullorum]STC94883.1 Helix-turn-helix [Chryseobacterium carnipullorum]
MKNENKENGQWQLLVLLLKEIADQKKITQNDIAELTGMQQSAISRLFLLKYKPTLETFMKVAQAIKVNFFFEDKENKSDLNLAFENAMAALGRRPDSLPQN